MDIIDNGFNVRDEFKSMNLEELKEKSNEDRLNYSILFLNVEKNINVSTLIRSAHLFGATNVFVIGSPRFDRRGLVGVQNYTNIIKTECDTTDDSLITIINSLKNEYNMKMVFLEQHENSMDLSSNEFKNEVKNNHCCIVVGNEGNGISKNIIDSCDGSVVEISQLGVVRSLNAGVAGSIVSYKVKEILEE